VAGTVTGGITNSGAITGNTGIAVVESTAPTTIGNSGMINGTGGTAIDVSDATNTAAFTINQMGGTIAGDILLSANGDTVNVTGGAINGNIVGQASAGTVNFALGSGVFVYSGAITGVNAVNVNSGTLFDNNSITAANVMVNGGTLAPGLPGNVGTLSITGNLAFASNANYLIAVNGANASQTNVTGGATLGGASVSIAPGSQIEFHHTYDILSASSSVNGTFNPAVSFNGAKGALTYGPNDAFLTFSSALAGFLPAASGINNLNVASAIDKFVNNGGTPSQGFLGLYGLSSQQLAGALTQASGEASTGMQQSGFSIMNSFMSLLLDPYAETRGGGFGPANGSTRGGPLGYASDDNGRLAYADAAVPSMFKAPPASYVPYWSSWATAFGGANRTSGDPTGVGSHNTATNVGGFAVGADYHFSADTTLGFALAGGGTQWSLSGGMGGGNSTVFQAGVYGVKQFGQAYVSGALAFAGYSVSTSRTVSFAGADTLNANFGAQSYGGRLETGYHLTTPSMPFTLTPYAAVQEQSFTTPSYNETAALGSSPFSLSYKGQTATQTRAELGSWATKTVVLADGNTLDVFGRAAWAHDWQSDSALTAEFLGLPGSSFIVNGAKPASDLALTSVGLEYRMRTGWSMRVKFDGEFGKGTETYAGTARLRYAW
jgi:outer membrane autotransporter protein